MVAGFGVFDGGGGFWRWDDEEADEDAMVDTRLLLMLKYPDDKAPLRERVALRYSALRYHVRRLLRDATRVSGAARDASPATSRKGAAAAS